MSGPLEPLLALHEAAGLPGFDLPAELARLYGGGFGLADPCLYASFVSTIDGVVAIPALPRSNALVADASEADRFVLGLLRASAGAVLVGSGTLGGSPGSRWAAEGAYPPAEGAYRELRRRLGLPPRAEVALLTASGAIDVGHPVLEAGALVLTTERGAARLRGRLPAASEAVPVGGGDAVDLSAAVACLRGRGHGRVLCEGGPTVLGALLEAGLVQELFLTVSPLLAGRAAAGERLALVEGAELLPSRRLRGRLLGVRSHGAHLFLRYGF